MDRKEIAALLRRAKALVQAFDQRHPTKPLTKALHFGEPFAGMLDSGGMTLVVTPKPLEAGDYYLHGPTQQYGAIRIGAAKAI